MEKVSVKSFLFLPYSKASIDVIVPSSLKRILKSPEMYNSLGNGTVLEISLTMSIIQ
ncbi:hypothetical protein KQI30_15275 [Clostridium bornimense]|uniref:hypothetical protein n=1 Tax=Clostridium bornimense TaxID=1216932 RepID=UPI001C12311C|nr:hypothetical protein [Clostridium bornimense]MBU5317612.1 hypothetical protein [Clostridium bornimense]